GLGRPTDRAAQERFSDPFRLCTGVLRGHHSTLNESNGSRHSRHAYSALHEVEPNRDTSWVRSDPQRGHLTARVTPIGPAAAVPDGGAMPNSVSLRRPTSLIQSVVHGGESTSSTRTSSNPAAVNAST